VMINGSSEARVVVTLPMPIMQTQRIISNLVFIKAFHRNTAPEKAPIQAICQLVQWKRV
jgi:hypothetical protein